MLEILGKKHYIDVDKLIEKCRPVYEEKKKKKVKVENEEEKQLELNIFKFECYKSCLERVLNDFPIDEDDGASAFTNKTTNTSFGIAFNTLLKNEIITDETDETDEW